MATTQPSHAAPRDVTAASAWRLNAIDWIALALMIIGGLNWGLVGLLNFDLVAAIFGPMTSAARAVYVLVGLAAVYGLVLAAKCARKT